jgi:CRISPR-associated endonuclease/helicase Cas3
MKGTCTQSFETFFRQAAGFSPYEFQVRMATGAELARLVRIPTGLGKTAAAVLGWVWRRRFADGEVRKNTPRRLVYCLPMRVLVEQVRVVVQSWLEKLLLNDQMAVHVLIGGEAAEDWELYPERDAILIGTQDMLLSRALNRGYGMSRYHWPRCFGLLNNDCLWVFDEVQLMGVGVATSAQLEAFRRKLGTFQQAPSIWMSATLDTSWLHTIDFESLWLGQPLELSDAERGQPEIAKRYGAIKPLKRASAVMGEKAELADEIAKAHQPGTLTLAIFNTVARAQQVHQELLKIKERQSKLLQDVELLLIHSRFRPPERQAKIEQLLRRATPGGTIAITTQVVEAGVDVSAKILFTELAPWASLVQRFGRCNRHGEFSSSDSVQVIWIDLPKDREEEKKLVAPYELEDLQEARRALTKFRDVGLKSLEGLRVKLRLEAEHVIRRRDFIDLFDTTPDLTGNDIDVSRFIRSDQNLDVYVFWRDVPNDSDPMQPHDAAPRPEELCPVPAHEFRKFTKDHRDDIWRWDALEERWSAVFDEHVYPGQMFLVRASAGGYSPEAGWDSSCNQKVKVSPPPELPPEAYDEDRSSATGNWETLLQHTEQLCRALDGILAQLDIPPVAERALQLAARFHDLGKAHPTFQNALPDGKPSTAAIWAKAAGKWKRYERKHFRHELASALAVLQANVDQLNALPSKERSLVAYLVAAHHGKVRLSIRSMPGEKTPDNPDLLYARGVWHGDELPMVDLGGGIAVPAIRLSLEPMQLGRGPDSEPSWLERMLELRDAQEWGSLRLSYLEAILRAADMRVSRMPRSMEEGSWRKKSN